MFKTARPLQEPGNGGLPFCQTFGDSLIKETPSCAMYIVFVFTFPQRIPIDRGKLCCNQYRKLQVISLFQHKTMDAEHSLSFSVFEVVMRQVD